MIRDLVERYQQDGDLLALLKDARRRYGSLSPALTEALAAEIGVKDNELFAVTSFYAFLSRSPVGRHVIRFCRCLPCTLKDSHAVLGTVERELGIRPGETTPDGRFTLQMVNCIGACDVAPALMIDETRHGNLTAERVVALLADYE